MTIEKAIEQLEDLTKEAESHMTGNKIDDEIPIDDKTALEMAIQALEKQVPKKIPAVKTPCHVKAFDSDTETVYTYSCVNCPVCSKWIVANVNHKYCQYCGQALDWSDENE